MSFLTPLFLLGLGRPRRAGDHSSDPAGAEERRPVSVADVPAADSVSIRPASADPELAAAAAAAGGAGLDRRGLCAAVLPAAVARCVAAGGAREVVILIDKSYSMGYGDRWSARDRGGARRHRPGRTLRSRVDRLLLVRRRGGAAIDSGPEPVECRGQFRQTGSWRDALRSGAEAGGQHRQRVDAAAA